MVKSFFALALFVVAALTCPPAEAAAPSCLQWVRPLEQQKDTVIENGGLWGYFERDPKLREQSAQALQLDRRINKVIGILKYLCQTQNGVPLNDLAQYVSSRVAEWGLEKFRHQMIILGKTRGEIDIWLRFTDYAQRNRSRTLDPLRIRETIDHAKPKIARYVELAQEISEQTSPDSWLQKTAALTRDLDLLFSSDPYLAQALDENSRVPYWDIDESVGGS